MMKRTIFILLITFNVLCNQFIAASPRPQQPTQAQTPANGASSGQQQQPSSGSAATPSQNQAPSNTLINQNPFGSLMSPFAGYTGFRSSMDQVAGAVSNVGSLLGTGVYTLVSEIFGALGGMFDSIPGMGVMNIYNSPTYSSQLGQQAQSQASQSGAQPTTPAPQSATTTAPTDANTEATPQQT